ncbi:ATP-binding protein, partial [Planctomycetota bacterium]
LIAQEAVINAQKHSNASVIEVELCEIDGVVILTVRDDGIGLSGAGGERSGMGLDIMNSRATVIGAVLEIGAGEKGGTVVTCSWKRDGGSR